MTYLTDSNPDCFLLPQQVTGIGLIKKMNHISFLFQYILLAEIHLDPPKNNYSNHIRNNFNHCLKHDIYHKVKFKL